MHVPVASRAVLQHRREERVTVWARDGEALVAVRRAVEVIEITGDGCPRQGQVGEQLGVRLMRIAIAALAVLGVTLVGQTPALAGDGREVDFDAEAFRASPDVQAYDEQVAAAMREADRLTALALERDPSAVPVPPRLPRVAVASSGVRSDVVPRPPHVPPSPSSTNGSRESCSGNCYETDSTTPSEYLPSGTYAFDYWLWLGIPQDNESNGCDGGGNGSCFWFQAAEYKMNAHGAGFHVGPQRGASLFGNSGDRWYLSHSGYNAPDSGSPVGEVCAPGNLPSPYCANAPEIPTATWVRVRVWRTSTYHDQFSTVYSRWDAWAMWGGVDRWIGRNLPMRGTTLTWANQFVEIYETDNQCVTDFERTYFNDPRSLVGSTWTTQPSAKAKYQDNCADQQETSTWERHGTWGAFFEDEREVTVRIIDAGDAIWWRRGSPPRGMTRCAHTLDRC